jgi:hypothetical protein
VEAVRSGNRADGQMIDEAYMLVMEKMGPAGPIWTVRKCPKGIDLKFRNDWYPNYWLALAETCRLNPPPCGPALPV